MELSPTDFDFKEVWQGMPAEREFTIKNSGDGPLTLAVRSSCGCTVATQPKTPLDPGQTTTFDIKYNTASVGAAHKTVTITTNDPEKPSTVIQVTGTVKAIIAASPTDRVFFQDAETNTAESQTIKLEARYDGPVNLKVRPGQSFGHFDVELKEVQAGRVYELTATTKPPLPPNTSNATVVLETGIEKAPTFNVSLFANVTPRVMVAPPALSVPSTTTQPMQQTVRVQHRLSTPLKITAVKPSVASITAEVMPEPAPPHGAKVGLIPIRITLPPFAELPPTGATIEIQTDDTDPQYQKLEVRVFRPPQSTIAPAQHATPVPPRAPTTRPAIAPHTTP